jgi:hypothetical protein
MPSTTDYYQALKTQLDTQAAAKKVALDLAYERMTSATFDDQGKMSRKTGKAPGTLDVQFDEQQRQLSGGAESSGMLKSGQFGRDLATSQAAYRTAVVGGAAETEAAKTGIENESSTELAKYKAMYGVGTSTTGGNGSPVAGGTPASDPLGNISAAPKFDPNTGQEIKPSVNRTDASGASGMGGGRKVVKKPAPVKVPVPAKIKTMNPGRM